MEKDTFRLTVLGARGSIPVSGQEFDEFGEATSCYMVEVGGKTIFLDAGTGIVNAPPDKTEDEKAKEAVILLSHPHLDHIMGLPFFPLLSEKGKKITIYGETKNNLNLHDQIENVFSEPYWPQKPTDYPADLNFEEISFPLIFEADTKEEGKITIDGMHVCHPGGNLAYRISYKGKTILYLTDYEQGDSISPELIEFAKDSDLVLFDAQYKDEDFEKRHGFGHSTAAHAKIFMEKTGSKKMLLIHHDPRYTDETINGMEKALAMVNMTYARKGEIVDLI
ncbi:MAG: MBL fold metallo-hydrolase [Butyrivibrio sp.]|nr:MBL fold metallo-hydrolase [Butyrivibrio sp.]